MKELFNTLIWAGSIGVILGAYITKIGALVTIATALYWIVSIILPFVLCLIFLFMVFAPEEAKQELVKAFAEVSTGKFIVTTIKTLATMGTYAVVGWSWPFAMSLIVLVVAFTMRFSNKEVE